MKRGYRHIEDPAEERRLMRICEDRMEALSPSARQALRISDSLAGYCGALLPFRVEPGRHAPGPGGGCSHPLGWDNLVLVSRDTFAELLKAREILPNGDRFPPEWSVKWPRGERPCSEEGRAMAWRRLAHAAELQEAREARLGRRERSTPEGRRRIRRWNRLVDDIERAFAVDQVLGAP